MPLYTIYPCLPDGASETFVTFDLIDDDEAYVRALHVLEQHATASHVAIWCGERKVAARHRQHESVAPTFPGNSSSMAQPQ